MLIDEKNGGKYLRHYGILRKSGRYPWGSGGDWGNGQRGNSVQRSMSFFDALNKLRSKGLSDTEIARGWGMTTTELRATTSIANAEKKAADITYAQRLKDKGLSNIAIGEKMGINESSVRALLAPGAKDRLDILNATTDMLRRQVEEKGVIDIGKGVELDPRLGISKERLGVAIAKLKAEGYVVHTVQVDQAGTQNKTAIKVLAKPGTTYRDIVMDKSQIKSISEVSEDGGRSWFGLKPPLSIDPNRVQIIYAEDGGDKADGLMYVRSGVEDVSIGDSRYAQVRVDVGGTHYLKGMAVYKDDLPDGVDIAFNTNKKRSDIGDDKFAAMKPLKTMDDDPSKIDPDNPFGAIIKRQILDSSGEKVTSAMNIVNEEGNWDTWSRNLSSQTLSKQSPALAKKQLDLAYERKRADFDEIMQLTNPAVREKLLQSFSDEADSAAVHLKAAALPRSSWHVIIPIRQLKDNEVYAPNYENGERVALIRYPHGGKFEIPELTVNNNNRTARSIIGPAAKDAIGINSKVAERLSGADFDGDAVIVIPNKSGAIKTAPALDGLKNFDPQLYRLPDDSPVPRMNAKTKATQMGLVSNLITDMTIQGANPTELAAAVRHSMVVIDAEKHNLNYKQSAIDNGIPNLMRKYQGRTTGGASTLISRAEGRKDVLARKPRPSSESVSRGIDKATGRKVYDETGESYVDPKTGKTVFRTMRSKKLAETDDAHTLSSGTLIEQVYADHSNRLKALANTARKEMVNTKPIPVSESAKKVYADEVKSLRAKLNVALLNSPRERQAQVIANTTIQLKRQANPDMDDATLKKIKSQALLEARRRTGAKKELVEITDREWEAIQAGAISNSRLKSILENSDLNRVKELATPRATPVLSTAKLGMARAMAESGYTQAQIADAIGVSLSTLKKGLKDD